jgi:hypothetical protein
MPADPVAQMCHIELNTIVTVCKLLLVGLASALVMQEFELSMNVSKLLENFFCPLEFPKIQQHRFKLLLAADQHTAFAGTWFVRHQFDTLKILMKGRNLFFDE